MLEVIYAPILDNILPPFQKNSKKEFEINIPFKHSSSLNDNWKGIKVIIYTASGNKIEERIIPRGFNITNDNIRIIITLDEEIRKYLSMGNFYKIQIKYDFGLENDKYNILNSNLGVIKCTGESSLEILGLDNINNVSIYYGNKITGKYSNTDITELPYSYKFDIYNNETGSLYISSGEKLHDSSQDNENNHYDSWVIPKVLEQNQTYKIKYSIKTTNGLKKDIEEFIIAPMTIKPEISDYAVFMAEPLSSIGGIKLFFKQKENTGKHSINGTWEILRKTENSSWEVVQKIQANLTPIEEFYWIDLTVEQNVKYMYGIREYNSFIYSNLLTIDSPISVDFEDIFLFDGNRQLCVRYNPQISSFKNNIFEQKTDTVGGKYPYIFRNGQTKYKEFPINGLISYQEENNKFFWITEKEEEGQRDTTPFSSEVSKKDKAEEVYLERQFKLQVLDWLNNGKPKLFRSSQEGNYLVYLSQVSLTPFDGTFRLVHSFSCTAYEIADNSYEELLKHNIYHQEILDLTDLTDSQKYQQINLEDITDTICVGPKAIARCCTSGESTYKIEDDTFIPLGDNTTINLDLLRAYDFNVNFLPDTPSDDTDIPEDEPEEVQFNQLVYSAYDCVNGNNKNFQLRREATPTTSDYYEIITPQNKGESYKIKKKNNYTVPPTDSHNRFLIDFGENTIFRYKSPYNTLSKSSFNYLVIGCESISPTLENGKEPMYYFSYRANVGFGGNLQDRHHYVQRMSFQNNKIIVPLLENFGKDANEENITEYEKFHIETIRFYPAAAKGGKLPDNLEIAIKYIGFFEDKSEAENFVYTGNSVNNVKNVQNPEEDLKIASYEEKPANTRYSLKFTPQKIFSYGNGKKIDKYSQDIDIEIKNVETIQYGNSNYEAVVQYGAKNANFNYMVSTDVLFDFKQLYEFDNNDFISISSVDQEDINGPYDGFNKPQIIYMRQYKIGNSITSIKYFLIDYTNQNSDFTNYETSDPVPNQATDIKRYWAGILFTIPAKNNAPEDLNKIAKIGTITLNTYGKQHKFPRDNFNSIFSVSKYNKIQLLYLNGYLETLKGEDNKNISYSNENLNQDIQIKLPIKRISAFKEKQGALTQPWKGQQYIQPSNINVEGIELLPQLSEEKAMYNRYYYNDELGVLNCKTVSGIENTEPGYAIVPINNEPALTLNLTNFSPYSKFYLGDKSGENKQEYLVGITGSLTLNNLPKDQEYFLIADKTLNGYQKGIINYSYNEKAIDNSLDSIASIEYIPATLQSFPQQDEDFDAQEQYDVIDGIHRQLGENGVLGYIYYIKLEKTQIPDGTQYPPDYYHQYSFDGKTWNNLLDENGAVKEIKGKLYLEHFYIRRGIIAQCSFDGWEINKREKGVV